jgi:hypothetical protein
MPEFDRIPDALLLAAVKRAQLNEGRDEGVAIWMIKAHLGLPHDGWTTRQVRPLLDALVSAGLLEHAWVRRRHLWAITSTGGRRASPFRELPESPQHRNWRESREAAGEHMSEFRRDAREVVAEATRLLDAGGDSAAWVEMGERLQHTCWRLASATYCLREWPEPTDGKADVEKDRRRLGRRAYYRWDLRPAR